MLDAEHPVNIVDGAEWLTLSTCIQPYQRSVLDFFSANPVHKIRYRFQARLEDYQPSRVLFHYIIEVDMICWSTAVGKL